MSGVCSSSSIASLPVSAEMTCICCALEHARHREDVADVVVDDQHLLAGQDLRRSRRGSRSGTGAPAPGWRSAGAETEAAWSTSRSSERADARSAAPAETLEAILLRLRQRAVDRMSRTPPGCGVSRTAAAPRRPLRSRARSRGPDRRRRSRRRAASRAPSPSAGCESSATWTGLLSDGLADVHPGRRVRADDQQVPLGPAQRRLDLREDLFESFAGLHRLLQRSHERPSRSARSVSSSVVMT